MKSSDYRHYYDWISLQFLLLQIIMSFTAKYNKWYNRTVKYITGISWMTKEIMKKQEEVRKKQLFNVAFVAIMYADKIIYTKKILEDSFSCSVYHLRNSFWWNKFKL